MTTSNLDLSTMRRFAVARSLRCDASLSDALQRLGFVQADPIRAPARSQDLVLRHRVQGYRAGQLESQYPDLDIEEDFFVNYGFVQPELQALMHPRTPRTVWNKSDWAQANEVLAFVAKHGDIHPKDLHQHLAQGTVRNAWGGSSRASTHWLDSLHYRGLLRITGRESGVRRYALQQTWAPALEQEEIDARLDALVFAVVQKYAPLTASGLRAVAGRLRYGVPQWRTQVAAAIARAMQGLGHARLDGVDWYWPADEDLPAPEEGLDNEVRLLSPFDPVVWDRPRFERLWGWPYRLEAYTPAPQRRFGHYALPVLWRDHMVGWANAATQGDILSVQVQTVQSQLKTSKAFTSALDEELERLRQFCGAREVRLVSLA